MGINLAINYLTASWRRGWMRWTGIIATSVTDITIIIRIASKITFICSGALAGCTFITTQDVREVGGGVVLVIAIRIQTSMTFVKICRRQRFTGFVNRPVDRESVKSDSDHWRRRSRGDAEQTARWLFVIVVRPSWGGMTVAHIKRFSVIPFYGIDVFDGPRVKDDKTVGGYADRSTWYARWLSCYTGVPGK